MHVLELRNVSKRFGEAVAVDNISFSVAKGGILALLGPSGCGKTTTLRLIAGFETPDSGELLIEGQDISGKRPYERNVGLLFQDYALFPHMTVAENIAYGLRFRGFNSRDAKARTEEMLNLVKLSGMRHAGRHSSAAASNSASRWPERLRSIRSSCSSMSHFRRWMRSCVRNCGPRSRTF